MQSSLQYLRVLLTLLLLVVPAGGALADGGFFGKGGMGEAARVSAPAQKAVILRDGDTHEILLLQTTYHGPAQDFAWVIPVPGLPARDDVFPANQALIDGVDTATQPGIRTVLRDPLNLGRDYEGAVSGGSGMMGPPGPGMGAPGAMGPTVVVHSRMEVGDYDATVLSATGPGVLTGWLRQHGYAFPEHGAPVIEEYVVRHWYFVALRMRPQAQREGSTLMEVAPIGIRFPARVLTFPLTISRVSAAEVTTLLLLVVDRDPVTCKELPVVVIPDGTKGERGSTYTSLARAQLSEKDGKALLCEMRRKVEPYEVSGGYMREDYHFQVPGPPRMSGPPRWALRRDDKVGYHGDGLAVTRFVAELPRGAMEDLTFRRTAEAPLRLQATYRATIPTPWWAYLVGTPWGRAGWVTVAFALVLFVLWPRSASAEHAGPTEELRRAAQWVGGLLGLLVVLVVLFPLLAEWGWPDTIGDAFRRHASASPEAVFLVQGLFSLWLAPGLVLGRRVLRETSRQTLVRAVPWSIGVLALLAGAYLLWSAESSGYGWDHTREPLLAATAFLGLLILCAVVGLLAVRCGLGEPNRGGIARAVAASLVSLLLLAPPVGRACAAVLKLRPDQYAVSSEQHTALEELRSRLRAFRDATGAYPPGLEDLAAVQLPAKGLDASGNEVALTGSPKLPLLAELPLDPLTRRRDTWVYDVRSPSLVESGGYEVEVKQIDGR